MNITDIYIQIFLFNNIQSTLVSSHVEYRINTNLMIVIL